MSTVRTSSEKARLAARILERVLSGDVAPELALYEWPNIVSEDNAILIAAWHDLSHFATDEDIRRKDRRYADYQRDLLERRIKEMKEYFRLE
jgi:predicted class III extradiol MEMO1 family dioxygenase